AASTCQDRDGDGFGLGCSAGDDCNDADATVHPGRDEQCNFRDDDCNALVDDVDGCEAPEIDPRRVDVPAGAFWMGSDGGAADERPAHSVELGAYSIDRHEVTNERYRDCVAAGACTEPKRPGSHLRKHYYEDPAFADYPVIFVSWAQADAFCRRAGGRLPTEAEWEKAARGRAPSQITYPWGDEAPDCSRANLGGEGSCIGDTDRIGRRVAGASPYGALDMAGNVWEWVADWYSPDFYRASPPRDPRGPEQGKLRVMRGGCWLSGTDSLRVSCRKAELPDSWAYNVGFRCAYPEGR
ncbi:MAG: SUMF1/EgtB/PvdO family nonheme iron enzyme, partial [Deltaproteobacteria bacterium]|nr:SUMF1/EgtB/PvdO family nonheme iron enzyme [Deltaproteobacteria bacterium]MBW2532607.1 SUMF1/EgtB/PvdO family nonheme iron enzyme [Deltaproteobacteria bacterium]